MAAGKTETFILNIPALFEPYYFKGSHTSIKNSLTSVMHNIQGLNVLLKRVGLYDKLRFYDGTYQIINPQNGNALIPKGMDDPEKKGVG